LACAVVEGFRSAGRTQQFLAAFSQISPHFRPRPLKTATAYRTEMEHRFTVRNQITGVSAVV
jgi:putative transposase